MNNIFDFDYLCTYIYISIFICIIYIMLVLFDEMNFCVF